MRMKTNRSCKIALAGLFAAALLFTQPIAQASIVGPYTADASTLHLWHMDASAVPVPDAVATGGINLVNLANGATLGAIFILALGAPSTPWTVTKMALPLRTEMRFWPPRPPLRPPLRALR
jgi:hypothetical protein